MTEKLYYEDSHLFDFSATVLKCEQDGKVWKAVLDRTAFFPEGGGQPGDRGLLGGVRVTDTHERGGEVVHYIDAPLTVGAAVSGSVDRELRLGRMQNHSGEHIFSGTAHRLFGCSNVGFHMGEDGMTLDFDCEMDADQVRRIETLANEAVRENLPVKVYYPTPDELKVLEYRSKKELEGAVRIVEIPGVDRCACCAPHVYRTGEIGVIKVLGFERHRGGVRLNLICGMQALEDYRTRQQSVAEISALLSAKRDEVSAAVQRVLQEKEALKEKNAALAMELVRLKAEQEAGTDGNICLFESIPDEIAMRELVNLLMEKCGGLAAVFFPGEEGVFRYIIGSRAFDLRKEARAINAGIGGRGGGRPEMIQGSARESEETIRSFLLQYKGSISEGAVSAAD